MAKRQSATDNVDNPELQKGDAPTGADYQESVENDKAVQDAKVSTLGEDGKTPQDGIADTPENNEILEADKQFKEELASGEKTVVGDIPQYNQSVVAQPLGKDYLSDRPVYPTAEAAMLAQAAKGELQTEGPSQEVIEKIQEDLKNLDGTRTIEDEKK